MKSIVRAAAVACTLLSAAMAAPVTFDYLGTFKADGIPDPFQPDSLNVTFSGSITLDPNDTTSTETIALVSSIDSFTIGSTVFNSSNVFAKIRYNPNIGSGSLGFAIGDATSGAVSNTDDFFFIFASDNAAPLSTLSIYNNARTALTFVMSNAAQSTFASVSAIGSVQLTARPVSEVPVPAALPLFLAGLAGLGFAKRRRAKATA